MELVNENIEKAIIRSQHTQRNWDLSREIPQEDLDLIITSATQCPSKQNVAHYRVHAITNRDIIEAIHEKTDGFTVSYNPYQSTTNSQVLANLLIVLEATTVETRNVKSIYRNEQTVAIANNAKDQMAHETLMRDLHMAVGVAAGYLNMTAALLGYGTGCCACMDSGAIKDILKMDSEPILLMGIGYKDPNLNRRVHHKDHSFVFPTKAKQEIAVNWYK
jgi:hypothetical protein